MPWHYLRLAVLYSSYETTSETGTFETLDVLWHLLIVRNASNKRTSQNFVKEARSAWQFMEAAEPIFG